MGISNHNFQVFIKALEDRGVSPEILGIAQIDMELSESAARQLKILREREEAEDRLVSLERIASFTGKSLNTTRAWIKSGKIPAVLIGHTYYASKKKIRAALGLN